MMSIVQEVTVDATIEPTPTRTDAPVAAPHELLSALAGVPDMPAAAAPRPRVTITPELTAGRSDDELYRWALELLDDRDPRAAVTLLEGLLGRARADDPASVSAIRRELVRAYYHSAALGRALDLGREAVAADPVDADLLVLVARALQRLARHDEARALVPQIAALLGPDHEATRLLRDRQR